MCMCLCVLCMRMCSNDYKFSEMNGKKPLIAILAPNLIGYPIHYIRKIMFKW